VVKRKRASHEDVLDLQVKVLKGKLEERLVDLFSQVINMAELRYLING
jgi:hypothetical protein